MPVSLPTIRRNNPSPNTTNRMTMMLENPNCGNSTPTTAVSLRVQLPHSLDSAALRARSFFISLSHTHPLSRLLPPSLVFSLASPHSFSLCFSDEHDNFFFVKGTFWFSFFVSSLLFCLVSSCCCFSCGNRLRVRVCTQF